MCASSARNVHGHSPEALRAMAAQYEEAPPLYEQVWYSTHVPYGGWRARR